jgi:hypothetical protein
MGRDPGRQNTHYVYGLANESGAIKSIGVAQHGHTSPWSRVWQARDQLPGKLAEWFRTLESPPKEITILGAAVGLDRKTARAVGGMLADVFPGCIRRTKPFGPRAVGRLQADGTFQVFSSYAVAARALRVRRQAIFDMVDSGRLVDLA